MSALPLYLVAYAALVTSLQSAAFAQDEPGVADSSDEPGIVERSRPGGSALRAGPWFEIDLGVGLSSLVVDPDLSEGIGGGIHVRMVPHRWLGVEAVAFVSNNPYKGDLGRVGSSFVAGNINLGGILALTPPRWRFRASADVGLGAYLVVPPVQENIWSLGVYFGVSLGFRLVSWFGIGLKLRYHLFNLARFSGPPMIDVKSFQEVGAVDRLELPGYVAFYF